MKEKGRKTGREGGRKERKEGGGEKGSLLNFKQLLGAKNIN